MEVPLMEPLRRQGEVQLGPLMSEVFVHVSVWLTLKDQPYSSHNHHSDASYFIRRNQLKRRDVLALSLTLRTMSLCFLFISSHFCHRERPITALRPSVSAENRKKRRKKNIHWYTGSRSLLGAKFFYLFLIFFQSRREDHLMLRLNPRASIILKIQRELIRHFECLIHRIICKSYISSFLNIQIVFIPSFSHE